ncbi:retron St85 family RNA-directed DNA polymerase, partial [Vibrio alginolyticus]|nr:retron St85 family RNA-directed DNA polymerase [Vibrio alginolyticus]
MKLVSTLSKKLEVNEQEILSVLIEAPRKYKVYTIPKRTHGFRLIAQPTKKLKKLQRTYIQSKEFPTHTNSIAYRVGYSIKDNAEFHAKNSYILKMDLYNFFNSITPNIFWKTWGMFWKEPERLEKHLIENLLFWKVSEGSASKLVLSVGAPSSPIISNFCLYFFDEVVTDYCLENDIYYTRYADDITFSTNGKGVLFDVPVFIKKTLNKLFGNAISINYQKTVFSSRKHNRHVTGLTLTNDGEVSIGRERKR